MDIESHYEKTRGEAEKIVRKAADNVFRPVKGIYPNADVEITHDGKLCFYQDMRLEAIYLIRKENREREGPRPRRKQAVQVYCSRFTPGVTGDNVGFDVGETVQYQLSDGRIINITIDSERMSHDGCPCLGYEAIFSDDGKRYFARGDKIVGWDGKGGVKIE